MTIEDSERHWTQLAKDADEHADYLLMTIEGIRCAP